MLFYDLLDYIAKKFAGGTPTVRQYFDDIRKLRVKNFEKRVRRKLIIRELLAGDDELKGWITRKDSQVLCRSNTTKLLQDKEILNKEID